MTFPCKLSILVPCYNVEKYVAQCLSSIVNQTLQDIEIICINDGSTDKTLEILQSFQTTDSRIKIINKKNSGYGDSMNLGLDMAKGKYIGIVESDDYIEPLMYEKLFNLAEKDDLEIARCAYFTFRGEEVSVVQSSDIEKFKVLNPNINTEIFWQAPAIWASIYKRDWLFSHAIRFLPTPGASYQDTSFAFKCYACSTRFEMIDVPLLHYRLDNENSSVNNPGKAYCVCDEWKEIYNFVRSDKPRFGHLYSLMPILRYGTYSWNYHRLAPELRRKFIIAWAKEIIIHMFKGELSLSKLDNYSKKKIFGVLKKALFSFSNEK
jgi:glycosyltransferase involved in cell wall biosynthesis